MGCIFDLDGWCFNFRKLLFNLFGCSVCKSCSDDKKKLFCICIYIIQQLYAMLMKVYANVSHLFNKISSANLRSNWRDRAQQTPPPLLKENIEQIQFAQSDWVCPVSPLYSEYVAQTTATPTLKLPLTRHQSTRVP